MQTKTLRFLSFVTTVAGVVGWSWHDASAAEHALLMAITENENCSELDPSGNYYMGEAYGYDSNNTLICEVIGVPAQELYLGECNPVFQGNATQVVVAITTRTSSFNYVSRLTASPTQAWTGAFNIVSSTYPAVANYAIPGAPGCGLNAWAAGVDTTSN